MKCYNSGYPTGVAVNFSGYKVQCVTRITYGITISYVDNSHSNVKRDKHKIKTYQDVAFNEWDLTTTDQLPWCDSHLM